MENKKEIKDYIKNEKIDLDRIVDDYTPYLKKVIQNLRLFVNLFALLSLN